LLRYISGLNSKSAHQIVEYRRQNGRFENREQLKQVQGIGEKSFQQAAGFLRIRGGNNPLDATSIHPESYQAAGKLLEKFSVEDIFRQGRQLKPLLQAYLAGQKTGLDSLARELGCGLPTLQDILDDLEKPGRDPRDELSRPVFRSDVLRMEDLKIGMIMKGTVRNVVDFGIFVDIGVKQDGLVHISQMSRKHAARSPYEQVRVGEEIKVKVLNIDLERKRIALGMTD